MPPGSFPGVCRKAGADDNLGDDVAQSQRVEFAAELIVVGQEIGYRSKAADFFQVGLAERKRRAETEFRYAEPGSHQSTGREIGGDSERFETAGPVAGFGAIETCHQADGSVRKWGGYVVQITGRDGDVTIVHDQQRIASLRHEIHKGTGLGIWRLGRTHDQPDRKGGEFGDQTPDVGARRIVGRMYPEEYLELRIFLERVRSDGLIEAGIAAIDRFEDGNS